MRIYLFFAILILGFTLIITAAVKPEVFKEQYQRILPPINQYQAEQNQNTWRKAREQEYAAWMLAHPIPPGCETTTSAVKQLECKYAKQRNEQQFENAWQTKTAQGWHP
jgi:hypothetical protein